MRLVIDARMLGHSGIGVYLSNILPAVLPQCATLDPIVLASPRDLETARGLAGAAAEVRPWTAPPLTLAELRASPIATGDYLWWVPHFNAPLRARLPLVATLHDLLPLADGPHRAAAWQRLAVRAWLRALRQRARHVICVSDFTRRQAIRVGRLDSVKMSVVPLGVDSRQPADTPSRAPGTPPWLLFVGLVKPHKNLAGLLRAFETIAANVPHRLIVVGRHRGLRGIDDAALAHARRLAPRVEVVEDIPAATLAALIAGADLLIQPSFHEGFGLPPLEAMAAGTPVLAARAGALPEVCGDAARYFDPASASDLARAIVEVLRDAPLRARMRDAGRERARLFTWEACARATTRILLAAAIQGTTQKAMP